jgi:tetratricopeptide (TPR) repeat protein
MPCGWRRTLHDGHHHPRPARGGIGGASSMTRTRLLPALALALVAACASLASAQETASRTLVMPFENPQGDARVIWLGEGSSLLLTEYLEHYGSATVTRDERMRAFERLQLPPAAALSHATMIKVGQFVEAADVLVGSYELAGDQVTVHVRRIALEAGRLTPEVVERGPLSELFQVYDRAAMRLSGRSTPAPPALARTLLASPQAFEAYVKGLLSETPSMQRTFLEQALKAAPADDRIRLALWQVHTNTGDHLRALDVSSAVPASSLYFREARYLSALSQIDLKRDEEAFTTLRALQADARSPEVLNAMGVVQLRRGGNPPGGKATYFFSQASQSDPDDPDYFFNLGYAYAVEKDLPAAIYWLREAVRREPADGDAHYVLAMSLLQTGASLEAVRERELAERLSSRYENAKTKTPGADPVPRGLERLKDYLERPGARVDSTIATTGQRDQAELATYHLEAGRRAFAREADRTAEEELRRAIYLSPYLAEAQLLLGRVQLRGGRTAEAIQALKIALWSEESATGQVLLAEAYRQSHDIDSAKQAVERALVLDPQSAEARTLAMTLGVRIPQD